MMSKLTEYDPHESPAEVSGEAAVRLAGRRLLIAMHAVLRILKLRQTASPELKDALVLLDRLMTSFQEDHGHVELHVVRKNLYLNSVRLQNDLVSFVAFDLILSLLQNAGIGVLVVDGAVGPAEWHGILGQLLWFAESGGGDKAAELSAVLTSRGIRSVRVFPPLAGAEGIPDELQRRNEAKRTYEQSVAVSKALFTGARMGRIADVRKVKHAVQSIVDQVLNNEASIGGLSTLKDYDDYSFTHSVNVCIFCVAIGRRLGLSKTQMYDLGLAALIHDMGMSRIPVEILTKGTALSADERRHMEAHTWLGALSAFRLRDYGDIPFRSMIAAYEHHMKVDLTGYPKPKRPRVPSVFSKIIAVAAAFDAATNERAYTPARPAGEVLGELWEDRNLGYDPVIVKALINLLGTYPIGTVVILDTYELALVQKPSQDPRHVHRPTVLLLCDADGSWLAPAPVVDLARTDAEGNFERTIIKVTKAERYGINVSDYFV